MRKNLLLIFSLTAFLSALALAVLLILLTFTSFSWVDNAMSVAAFVIGASCVGMFASIVFDVK